MTETYNNGKDIMPEDLQISEDGKRITLGFVNPRSFLLSSGQPKIKLYTLYNSEKLKEDDILDFVDLFKTHLLRAFRNK